MHKVRLDTRSSVNGRLQVIGSDFNSKVVAQEVVDMREVSSAANVYHLVCSCESQQELAHAIGKVRERDRMHKQHHIVHSDCSKPDPLYYNFILKF